MTSAWGHFRPSEWGRIKPSRPPGPKPVPDRLCLQGILHVLHQDIAWQLLPLELGFGYGRTCWRA